VAANAIFAGTSVISGSARAIVAHRRTTSIGGIADQLTFAATDCLRSWHAALWRAHHAAHCAAGALRPVGQRISRQAVVGVVSVCDRVGSGAHARASANGGVRNACAWRNAHGKTARDRETARRFRTWAQWMSCARTRPAR
jgi:hypothetical protein